jgi:hypothetical protein
MYMKLRCKSTSMYILFIAYVGYMLVKQDSRQDGVSYSNTTLQITL